MKELYEAAHHLMWVTQFGLSIAVPLVVCIFSALFLQRSFSMGAWVVVVGVILGVLGAASGLHSSLKAMERQGRSKKKEKPQPVSYNRH